MATPDSHHRPLYRNITSSVKAAIERALREHIRRLRRQIRKERTWAPWYKVEYYKKASIAIENALQTKLDAWKAVNQATYHGFAEHCSYATIATDCMARRYQIALWRLWFTDGMPAPVRSALRRVARQHNTAALILCKMRKIDRSIDWDGGWDSEAEKWREDRAWTALQCKKAYLGYEGRVTTSRTMCSEMLEKDLGGARAIQHHFLRSDRARCQV